jgi:uncharacterized membrane protein YdjX (TVP38/TMEM64 family)
MAWLKTNWVKIRKFVPAITLILLATVLVATIDIKSLEGFITRHKYLGIGLSFLLYILLGATIIPSEPLTVMITAFGGVKAAVLLAFFGNTMAAILEYYIGGRIGDFSQLKNYQEKLPAWLQKFPLNSPIFLILGRMLPGYGPKFISLICGIYKIPFFLYLWTTMVTNALGALLIAFGAYGVIQIF